MEIQLDDDACWQDPGCQRDLIQTRWWVYRDRRLISTWKYYWGGSWNPDPNRPVQGTYLGGFDSSHGSYSLDIELMADATYLQKFHPRLRVYTDKSDYARGGGIDAMVLLAACGLMEIGIAFPAISAITADQRPVKRGESLAIFGTLRTERESSQRKLLLMQPASIFPTIGYFYALTVSVLFLVCGAFSGVRTRSYGIPVHLLHAGVIQESREQPSGLLVYVGRDGSLYLNSKPIRAEELARAIQDKLARRADWSVYVDGDSDADYASVVRAMDLVRSAQGKVILLTRNTRAEAQGRRN